MIKHLIFTLLLCSFVLQTSQAQRFWKKTIRGEGPSIVREVEFDSFSGIANGFSANVYLTQGNSQSVVLHGQANILDNLRMDVDHGVLKIKYDRMVHRAARVEIHITVPHLEFISSSGSGQIESVDQFTDLGEMELRISGSGGINFHLDAEKIKGKISGSGGLHLEGTTRELVGSISGSGRLQALDLAADHCDISVSGSGGARVNVGTSLTASVSGSGGVKYQGDDIRVNSKVSGSGRVRAL